MRRFFRFEPFELISPSTSYVRGDLGFLPQLAGLGSCRCSRLVTLLVCSSFTVALLSRLAALE